MVHSPHCFSLVTLTINIFLRYGIPHFVTSSSPRFNVVPCSQNIPVSSTFSGKLKELKRKKNIAKSMQGCCLIKYLYCT